jgi:Fe-S-cluster containining protein
MTAGAIAAAARNAARLALADGPAAAARAAIAAASAAIDAARADAATAARLDGLACRRGCTGCCHQMVGITPAEAALLAEGLAALEPAVRDAVLARAAATAAQARGLDLREWTRLRLACPLLDGDGACLVHDWRPLPCRGFNSADADICRRAFAAGEAVRIPVLAVVFNACAEAQSGLAAALDEAGIDPGPLTLVACLNGWD